jgi:protein-tyrosine phosphatase
MGSEIQTVLFVCTGNYYRSRYAEELFNARVPATLGWRADSRGFEPSPANPGPISRSARQRLQSLGIAPAAFRDPIRLREADLGQARLVVMLDEHEHRPYMQDRFPNWEGRVTYWRIADLWALTVDQALGLIDQEVERLIETLTGAG